MSEPTDNPPKQEASKNPYPFGPTIRRQLVIWCWVLIIGLLLLAFFPPSCRGGNDPIPATTPASD